MLRKLGDIPVGLAVMTDRVLPVLMPTPNPGLFRRTLQGVGGNQPAAAGPALPRTRDHVLGALPDPELALLQPRRGAPGARGLHGRRGGSHPLGGRLRACPRDDCAPAVRARLGTDGADLHPTAASIAATSPNPASAARVEPVREGGGAAASSGRTTFPALEQTIRADAGSSPVTTAGSRLRASRTRAVVRPRRSHSARLPVVPPELVGRTHVALLWPVPQPKTRGSRARARRGACGRGDCPRPPGASTSTAVRSTRTAASTSRAPRGRVGSIPSRLASAATRACRSRST